MRNAECGVRSAEGRVRKAEATHLELVPKRAISAFVGNFVGNFVEDFVTMLGFRQSLRQRFRQSLSRERSWDRPYLVAADVRKPALSLSKGLTLMRNAECGMRNLEDRKLNPH